MSPPQEGLLQSEGVEMVINPRDPLDESELRSVASVVLRLEQNSPKVIGLALFRGEAEQVTRASPVIMELKPQAKGEIVDFFAQRLFRVRFVVEKSVFLKMENFDTEG